MHGKRLASGELRIQRSQLPGEPRHPSRMTDLVAGGGAGTEHECAWRAVRSEPAFEGASFVDDFADAWSADGYRSYVV